MTECPNTKLNKSGNSDDCKPRGGDQQSRLHIKFNDCIWIKNQHIWRNEIFLIFSLNLGLIVCWALVPLILSNFSFLWIRQFFQNFHSPFVQFFLKDCITCFSELYMKSFSDIDFYSIAYEVCMNFTQSKHAFLPKKEKI